MRSTKNRHLLGTRETSQNTQNTFLTWHSFITFLFGLTFRLFNKNPSECTIDSHPLQIKPFLCVLLEGLLPSYTWLQQQKFLVYPFKNHHRSHSGPLCYGESRLHCIMYHTQTHISSILYLWSMVTYPK